MGGRRKRYNMGEGQLFFVGEGGGMAIVVLAGKSTGGGCYIRTWSKINAEKTYGGLG